MNRLREWVIKKLVGNSTVIINVDINLHKGVMLNNDAFIYNCSLCSTNIQPMFKIKGVKE